MTWAFDVAVSDHELLQQGITVGHRRHFRLSEEEFPTWIEASEAAILWGFYYGYVTDCVTVEWPGC